MKYGIFILTAIFSLMIRQSFEFIIQAKQGSRKCFKAQQSPDKTLQVKFGFPRRQQQNCDVFFSVQVMKDGVFQSNIYSDMHRCHQMNPSQPTVVKHTSEGYQMSGNYQICFQVIQANTEDLLLQIFIGQKLNPLLYSDGEDVLPLIQAEQLIELELKVKSIRKSLGWSRKMLGQGRVMSDQLQLNLNSLNQFQVNATIFQIIFLIIYAIVWIVFIKQQKVK